MDGLPEILDENVQDVPAQHLQVGMVLTHVNQAQVFQEWDRAKSAEATRLWAQFFYQNIPGTLSISIPELWANFFTVMLLSPIHFNWAREFLASKAFQHFQNSFGSITYNIPDKCPANGMNLCLTEILEDQSLLAKEKGKMVMPLPKSDVTPPAKSTPRKRGHQKNTPISDSEVRRSERLTHKSNGFKSTSCSDKRCISCSPAPPLLSNKLIQKLGTDFCKMDPAELSDEALARKKKKTSAIGKKVTPQEQEQAGTR